MSQVACVLQCGGIWKGGKGWGLTWKVIQCVVKPREVVSVYGQCRVMLSDEDRGAIASQKIEDNDDVDETVFTKTEQHDVTAEDSDDDGEAIPDIVADESAAQEAAVEEEAPAPKKKVVKKKVAEPASDEAPAPKKKVVKKKKVVAEEAA